MIFDWYKVINKTDFEATELVSQEVTLILEDIGSKDFLITKGNLVSITVDDTMLSLGLKADNPFVFNDRAIYLDPATQDIYYGVLVE